MDGVSWSTTRPPESFGRSKTTSDTLSRLASFIARADPKHHRLQRQQTSPLSALVCQECDEDFSHTAELLQHQELKHSLPKPHRCPSCAQEFSLKSSLKLHRCEHATTCELCRGDSRLGSACPGCTTRMLDPISLHDKSVYTCAPCGRGYSQKQALLHHQQAGCSESVSSPGPTETGRLPNDSPPVSEGDSMRSNSSDAPKSSRGALSECKVCSRSFRSEAGLERHKQTCHAPESQAAPRGLRTKEGSLGIGTIRGLLQRSESKNKLVNCRSCDLVFRSTSKLYLHRKEKHSRDKVVLRESRPATAKHRRTGAYPCQVCGKVFLHHLSLRAHYKQHAELSLTAAAAKHTSNAVKSSSATNKTVRAGPGRPRRVPTGPRIDSDPGISREVPEEKEQEEQEQEQEREVEEEQQMAEQQEEQQQEELKEEQEQQIRLKG